MTRVLLTDPPEERDREEGDGKSEAGIGVMWLQAQEHQGWLRLAGQPPEAGRRKGWILSYSLHRDRGPGTP